MTVSHLATVVPAGTGSAAVMHHEAFAALAGMSALAATSNMAALEGPRAPSPHPHPQSKRGVAEMARKEKARFAFNINHFSNSA